MRSTTGGILLSLLLIPAAAAAQGLADYDYANLRFRGIGLDYGYIWPSKVESTEAFGLRLDLGFLGPGLRIMPGISYWSSKVKRQELERLAERLNDLPALQDRGVVITAQDLGEIDWSDLTLSLDAQLVWTAPFRIITYAGAGVGVHVLNGRGALIDNTFVEDLLDSVSAGLAVMGGLEYEVLRPLRIYGEARYTLANDIHYPGVRIGAALMFPGHPGGTGGN